MVTRGYRSLEGVTRGYRGTRGLRGLQRVTGACFVFTIWR